MGNPLKKKLNRLLGKGSPKSKGWEQGQVMYQNNVGETNARNAELDSAMKEYNDVPTSLRKSYTEAAQRAGTYANTPEFASGMDSEVQAGARGARVALASRINALKKALGHTDEFKPEGLGETQGGQTRDALVTNPEPTADATATAAPKVEAPVAEETEAAPTATSSIQDSPSFKSLSKVRINRLRRL